MINGFRKLTLPTRILALPIAVLFLGVANVRPATNETETTTTDHIRKEPPTGWGSAVTGGYVHQFDSNIDSGGSFSKDSAIVEAAVRYGFTPDRSAAFTVGYGYEHYDFSGTAGLGGSDPWTNLQTLRFGAPVIWGVGDAWKIFAISTVRFQFETGADLGDSLSGGGFIGFSYKVNDRLTIGPGFGAITQLEDRPTYFPVLIVDWQISEHWSLSTGRGIGATLGPGLVLGWKPVENWRFGIGARYDKVRFRLNDNGTVAPNGVGEDRSSPVFLSAEYSPNRELFFSVVGGAQMDGELKVDDQNGNRLAGSDYDIGAFVGVTFGFRF